MEGGGGVAFVVAVGQQVVAGGTLGAVVNGFLFCLGEDFDQGEV